MDQSLVHTLFLGKFVWTNGPESSSKISPYTGIGPWMALPSEFILGTAKTVTVVLIEFPQNNLWTVAILLHMVLR